MVALTKIRTANKKWKHDHKRDQIRKRYKVREEILERKQRIEMAKRKEQANLRAVAE